MKQIGNLLHVHCIVEWSGITNLALVRRNLALQALNQMANGHSRRDGVRVDDNVRCETFTCEGHVLLSELDNRKWLTMPILSQRIQLTGT